jgi:hypothetical protein
MDSISEYNHSHLPLTKKKKKKKKRIKNEQKQILFFFLILPDFAIGPFSASPPSSTLNVVSPNSSFAKRRLSLSNLCRIGAVLSLSGPVFFVLARGCE